MLSITNHYKIKEMNGEKEDVEVNVVNILRLSEEASMSASVVADSDGFIHIMIRTPIIGESCYKIHISKGSRVEIKRGITYSDVEVKINDFKTLREAANEIINNLVY